MLSAEQAAYRPAHIPMNINEVNSQVWYGVRLPACICVKAWRSGRLVNVDDVKLWAVSGSVGLLNK